MLIRAITQAIFKSTDVVQVNIPAESGEMGVLAQHVPSIEQLKPGLVEVIEEGGSSKQFFRMCSSRNRTTNESVSDQVCCQQYPEDLPLSSPTRS